MRYRRVMSPTLTDSISNNTEHAIWVEGKLVSRVSANWIGTPDGLVGICHCLVVSILLCIRHLSITSRS